MQMDTLLSTDLQLLKLINIQGSHPFFDWFFPLATDLHHQAWFVGFVFIPLVALWIYMEKRKGLYLFLMLTFAVGFTDFTAGKLIKNTFERPRPFVENSEVIKRSPAAGFSYFSVHAADTFALAFFMRSFYPASAIAFYPIAIIVAYSRVYNGVHYPLDVVSGALYGTLIAFLVTLIAKKYLRANAWQKS